MTQNQIKKLENSHVAFWLLKDTSWCQHWIYIGLIAAVPTLFVSLKIAWESRHEFGDCVHNIAVCLWIMANIVWMIGELFFDDGTRGFARLFFYTGLIMILGYYLNCVFQYMIGYAKVPY